MSTVQEELQEALDRILQSDSRKKLVVAGPGAGKTFLFKTLLNACAGTPKSRLVLTFINNLRADLDKSLGEMATVYTLHGYCQSCLHRHATLRGRLTEGFRCVPGLASLIKSDWKHLETGQMPSFVDLMRTLQACHATDFYLERSDYYDAVDFDDSVFRLHQALATTPAAIHSYDLLLIDEYQDFNALEAGVIDLLASKSPIVIAGDDDQALYSQLKRATWDFIRTKYRTGEYAVFPLPFCLRCPEVIVSATNDVIRTAQRRTQLQNRIDKPFRAYEPRKGADSRQYPKIMLVQTSVQRPNANYFGRYIAKGVKEIPPEELAEAATEGYPAALVIANDPYRRQVVDYLTTQGHRVDTKTDRDAKLDRRRGLELIKEDPTSNIGWRIVVEVDEPAFLEACIKATASRERSLAELLPDEYRGQILREAEALEEPSQASEPNTPDNRPVIKVTTYEGAKGLSAQHVFIVGLHEGELPRQSDGVQDLEICKFIVGLTRTRKKCSILVTRLFGDKRKNRSPFIGWIKPERFESVSVDANYWRARGART